MDILVWLLNWIRQNLPDLWSLILWLIDYFP